MSNLRGLAIQVIVVGNVSHSLWQSLHRVIVLACLLMI